MSDGDLAVLLVGDEYRKAKTLLHSEGAIKDDSQYVKAQKLVANVEALLTGGNGKYYRILFGNTRYPLENPLLNPKDYENVGW